ncbi:unnamed protein product [Laminaria digitata]
MLVAFLRPELRRNNLFAHPLLLTHQEKMKLVDIHNAGWDKTEVFLFECGVTERTLYDGSFDEVMLLPERLDDDVPNKSRVIDCLRRCLSTARCVRPSMGAVWGMLDDLLDFDD